MKILNAPAGERTLLYQIRQGSLPLSFDFSVAPVNAEESLSGVLEVTASSWIVPQAPQRLPLQARHQVERGMFNTFFTLAIIPDVTVEVTMHHGHFSAPSNPRRLFFLFGLLGVAIILLALFLVFLRG